MRKHSGERPFKCTLCSFASSVVGALNVHIKRHGGEQYLNAVNAFTREYHCLNWRDIWKCTAKKSFTNVSNVSMDFTIKETWLGIWENTLEKNLFSALQCSQCEFASSHKRSLKIHLLAHSGEKAHKCNQCDYATTQGGRLKTHTGERPYKCIQCDHTFSQKSNMRSHIKKCHRWLRSLEILFKIKKN